MNPEISDRLEEVLASVVRTYVDSARPVGSACVAEGLGLSPATIRNEFAELERRGLLAQPHPSAGRVPTERGYRLFVDRLLRARQLTEGERRAIEHEYERGRAEIETLMRQTARILSAMTRLAGVAFYQAPHELALERFRLVPLSSRQVLVLLVLEDVWVEREVVRLEDALVPGELSRIARLLNHRFAGRLLPAIREELLAELERSRNDRLAILQTAVDLLDGALGVRAGHLIVEGASRLVEQPEFREPRALESVLKALDAREELARALDAVPAGEGLRVVIGGELRERLLKDCSVVHVPCRLSGKPVGSLGVLGPTRMAYDRVAGVVQHVAAVLEEILTERPN